MKNLFCNINASSIFLTFFASIIAIGMFGSGSIAWAECPKIDGGASRTIKGKNVCLFKIDGGSRATVIAEQDIIIEQKIDGGSQARLKAGGRVFIGQKIDGGSDVTICAGEDIEIRQKIDGGSTLRWYARSLYPGHEGVRSANDPELGSCPF